MANKGTKVQLKETLKESIQALSEVLDKKPKDLNAFLESKTLGLTLELYEQDENYDCDKILKAIIRECEERDCLYAYCLHDSDFFTENTFDVNKRLIGKKGQKKQNHYHVVIQFNYPSIIGDFINKLGLDDEAKFSRFIKKLKNPREIDNMLLYLSHIKYPNKHPYYDLETKEVTKYIVSNRLDYCNYIHMTYKPKSAIKYAIRMCEEHEGRYLLKSDVFMACDEAEIGYDDYLKAYRVVKDIIDEHNRTLEIVSPKLEQSYMRLVKDKQLDQKDSELTDKKIRELAETFGAIRVEFAGKDMMVVNIPQGKKLFDEGGNVEQAQYNILKERFEEE